MTTRHLIDDELIPGLEFFPAFELDGADLVTLREASVAALPDPQTYSRDDVVIEHCDVPGPAGSPDVHVILYRPVNVDGPLPVFLNIHGGGYLFGSAADMGAANVRTAAELGCLVASPEYRLAPETRAPGAVEDCYAVLLWLHGRARDLGLDRTRFAIGGMSAGGGLAAALGLLTRDRGEIELCFQMLIYPMLDDRTAMRTNADDNPVTGEFVWTRAANRFGWEALLGHEVGKVDVSPYAVPARAGDLARLPSTYITIGMLDLFLEENIAYAHRLIAAGVPTELHIIPGAYHGFELAQSARLTRRSEDERRRALAEAFSRRL